jgi:DNA repair exonuclease SbcCD ATPase subunit
MIRPTASAIKNASEMLELVRLLSSAKGIEQALATLAEERAALDQREADLQTRENAIADRVSGAEAAEARAQKAEASAERAKAKADLAVAEAKAEDKRIAEARADLATKAKALTDTETSLKKSEQRLAGEVDAQAKREAELNERAAALDIREQGIADREDRIRAAFNE